MNNNTESIFNTLKKQKLTEEEKSTILHAVHVHLQENPYRKSPSANQSIVSPYIYSYKVTSYKKYTAGAMMAVFLTASIGTSFASENALPGDILYPVKIHVKEKLESVMAVSQEKEAVVETKHALTRIKEAQTLLEKGKLTTEINDEIKGNFEKKVERVNTIIEKLNDDKKYEAALSLHTALQDGLTSDYTSLLTVTHKKEKEDEVRKDSHGNEEATSSPVTPEQSELEKNLVVTVREKKEEIRSKRKNTEKKFIESVSLSGPSQLEALTALTASTTEKNLKETKEYLLLHKASSTPEINIKTETLILEAETIYQEGIMKMTSGDYTLSLELLNKSNEILNQARQFADVGTKSLSGFKQLINDEEIRKKKDILRDTSRNDTFKKTLQENLSDKKKGLQSLRDNKKEELDEKKNKQPPSSSD